MNLVESVAEDVIAEPRQDEFATPEQELIAVRAKLALFKQRHDDLVGSFREPGFEERKSQFIADVADRWSQLVDREWTLMKQVGETGGRTSLKEFFAN